MTTILRALSTALAVMALLAAAVPAGDVYRWRDADGVLHFTDTPPPDAAAERIHSAPDPAPSPEPAEKPPATAAPKYSGGVFWRIDPPGRPSSFLLGTIHSADPRVTALKPEVARAFDQATILIMEMDLNLESFLSLGASMMFTDDQDLEQLLGRSDFRKVVNAVAKRGIPEQLLRRMKPWAVLALLSQPTPQSGAIMDMVLYQKATAAGKPVFGLESAEEQIAVFNQMPMSDQVGMLRATLAQKDQLPAMQRRMIETYLSGDLDAIAALSDEMISQDASGLNQRFMVQLNDARNDRMVTRMTPHIESGGAFIAVGALHLTGKRSLIRQLRARGYRLSPVN